MVTAKIKRYIPKKELILFYKHTGSSTQREWLRDSNGEIFFMLLNVAEYTKHFRGFRVGNERYKMGYASQSINSSSPEYYVLEEIKHRIPEAFDYVRIQEYFRFDEELVIPNQQRVGSDHIERLAS
ncbi:hypothetical protein G7B40_037730 [Aetokthonos hydrillicola Thurmond2011]|jgi:hypothetical protein|uniref:Uncharacterized protein n=1 Tax=Aetokthonos hydrillicola Thurmond2011 TaxID=2712845 RepID=A0AAP5IEL1_9CYAN|nr:hypothetical protein [Aetokthonos hydrillicola]MBO3461191.1 hypothetical protein [Aetokthonos hydrillicola CCALA 1050]MBW4589755.1 hypothetical protein [Aetokthonos hydrillicola CCALA 1050]MDR9900251.1 hypothetical protein [Aetokthonos hydrillicola Thurmond2011]